MTEEQKIILMRTLLLSVMTVESIDDLEGTSMYMHKIKFTGNKFREELDLMTKRVFAVEGVDAIEETQRIHDLTGQIDQLIVEYVKSM